MKFFKTKLFILSAVLWISITSVVFSSSVPYPPVICVPGQGTAFWNVKGSGSDTHRRRYTATGYKDHTGWLALWRAANGLAADTAVNCANCNALATKGGHVVFTQAYQKPIQANGASNVYILPICTRCNNNYDLQMAINANAVLNNWNRAVNLSDYCRDADGIMLNCQTTEPTIP